MGAGRTVSCAGIGGGTVPADAGSASVKVVISTPTAADILIIALSSLRNGSDHG